MPLPAVHGSRSRLRIVAGGDVHARTPAAVAATVRENFGLSSLPSGVNRVTSFM